MSGAGRRRRAAAAIIVVALAGAVVAATLAHRHGSAPVSRAALSGATALPEPTASGLTIPDPRPLPDQSHTAVWAPVRRAVVATERPRAGSAEVAPIEERTPEGTTNLVLVVGRTTDAAGRVWLRARLPALPAGATGWIPRDAAGGYVSVDTRLVVDRAAQTLTLTRGGRGRDDGPGGGGDRRRAHARPASSTCATGSPGIAARRTGRSPSAPARARPRSPTGRPAASSASTARISPRSCRGVSRHGCIRLRNGDILRLAAADAGGDASDDRVTG